MSLIVVDRDVGVHNVWLEHHTYDIDRDVPMSEGLLGYDQRRWGGQ
jgi:hypothetical protein